eukprot:gene18944-20850_t
MARLGGSNFTASFTRCTITILILFASRLTSIECEADDTNENEANAEVEDEEPNCTDRDTILNTDIPQCVVRYELQFDFQDTFSNNNNCYNCLCVSGFGIIYTTYPPYIYSFKKDNSSVAETKGLLYYTDITNTSDGVCNERGGYQRQLWPSVKVEETMFIYYENAPYVFYDKRTNSSNGLLVESMQIIYYNAPPYILYDNKTKTAKGILKAMLSEAIKLCCFGCNRINYKPPIKNLAEMFSQKVMNYSYTAILPVLATKSVNEYFAGPFISILATPGVTYVTKYNEVAESLGNMLNAISHTWQLLVLSIMLSLNAGFIVWILDTRKNETDFPRAFPQGAIEGSWWAFVSMTTVGYGDRCPKSITSRMFAIIWILFGIALSGIFTASLTSALTMSASTITVDLRSKKVGVLNTTRYEQNIAVREGAIPVEFADIKSMKAALKSDQIAGLLVDNNVLGYYWTYIEHGMKLSVNTKIKNSDTNYGIMFLTTFGNNKSRAFNKKWADFLSTFFSYNRDNENIMLAVAKKKLDKEISLKAFAQKTTLSGFSSATYMVIFKWVAVSTACFTACGIIYEIARRIFCKHKAARWGSANLTVNGVHGNKEAIVFEMSELEGKAEALVRDLEKIISEMKSIKNKPSQFIDQKT